MHVHAGRFTTLPLLSSSSLSSLLPPSLSLTYWSLFILSLFFCFYSLVTLCPCFYPLHHPLASHPARRLHPPLAPKTVQVLNQEVLASLCLCLCVEKGEEERRIDPIMEKNTLLDHLSSRFTAILPFFVLLFFSSRVPHRYKRTAHAQVPSSLPIGQCCGLIE